MQPQFSSPTIEVPLRIDSDGRSVMPEWSDDDLNKVPEPPTVIETPQAEAAVVARVKGVRTPRPLQPDASQMDSVTQAKEWLDAHPEEAKMLREAHAAADILTDSDTKRWYSSPECAAFFDKTVQWLYWGMRHPPNGGRLFVEPWLEDDGKTQRVGYSDKNGVPAIYVAVARPEDDTVDFTLDVGQVEEGDEREGQPILSVEDLPGGEGAWRFGPLIRDIPVEWLGEVGKGKRRFDIPTIRKFAKSAYYRGNIKEPKLTAVLQRLVVAERGGNWKVIPIPTRPEDEDGTD